MQTQPANEIKTHLLWVRPGPFAGSIKRGSRCGRLRNLDDMNVTVEPAEVTCHFCKQIMARGK